MFVHHVRYISLLCDNNLRRYLPWNPEHRLDDDDDDADAHVAMDDSTIVAVAIVRIVAMPTIITHATPAG